LYSVLGFYAVYGFLWQPQPCTNNLISSQILSYCSDALAMTISFKMMMAHLLVGPCHLPYLLVNFPNVLSNTRGRNAFFLDIADGDRSGMIWCGYRHSKYSIRSSKMFANEQANTFEPGLYLSFLNLHE